ncbi:hypothetical protein GCM10022254_31940 [Actinomadura meridiana]|uniref:DUF1579 domain-containing protein n=1 Tax=Actinomadura meridiana TaxID=559626 RepID=A0ABP8C256_9ACTN
MSDVKASFTGTQPPPEQMRDLDFLLGSMSCVFNTGTKITGVFRSILGGHYYEFELTANRTNGQQVNGRWLLGWNSADKMFSSYYYDDTGMQGSTASEGWRDGELIFHGRYTLGDGHVEMRTVFSRVDEDHFVIRESILQDGEWKLLDTQDCHRTPLD